MNKKRKLPGIPHMVPRKYCHEIRCVMRQFQDDIISDILKGANLDDEAFLEVVAFSDFHDTPTGTLKFLKDIKGNCLSKRLFELRIK